MNIEIANRLVELRKKNNLSQEELADKLGLSRQAVSKWERAEASPDTDNLICLAKIYGVSLDDLLNTDQSVEDIAKETKEKESEKDEKESSSEDKGKEQVSIGPGHIYVHNDKEHVDIGLGHIHVIDEDGKEVHIGKGHFEYPEDDKKEKRVTSIVFLGTLILALVAYLLMGFLLNTSWTYGASNSGWALGWMVFFVPFIVSSIVDAILNKKAKKFNIAFLTTNAYLICGLCFGLWHPTWVIFLAIPAYYIIVGGIEKAIQNKKEND
ncbi:MAG TPA: hypothetical protein DDW20_02735 [Firmicutes bacterium]|nr:hypothetical protein [Bacillota bacterium]